MGLARARRRQSAGGGDGRGGRAEDEVRRLMTISLECWYIEAIHVKNKPQTGRRARRPGARNRSMLQKKRQSVIFCGAPPRKTDEISMSHVYRALTLVLLLLGGAAGRGRARARPFFRGSRDGGLLRPGSVSDGLRAVPLLCASRYAGVQPFVPHTPAGPCRDRAQIQAANRGRRCRGPHAAQPRPSLPQLIVASGDWAARAIGGGSFRFGCAEWC